VRRTSIDGHVGPVHLEATMNIWKVTTVALGACLVGTLAVSSVPTARAEPQPHMQAALASLRVAKDQLQKASPDKGGHRVKAIALTDQAIDEVKKGIEFDNNH
jgi:hypothetical protein